VVLEFPIRALYLPFGRRLKGGSAANNTVKTREKQHSFPVFSHAWRPLKPAILRW